MTLTDSNGSLSLRGSAVGVADTPAHETNPMVRGWPLLGQPSLPSLLACPPFHRHYLRWWWPERLASRSSHVKFFIWRLFPEFWLWYNCAISGSQISSVDICLVAGILSISIQKDHFLWPPLLCVYALFQGPPRFQTIFYFKCWQSNFSSVGATAVLSFPRHEKHKCRSPQKKSPLCAPSPQVNCYSVTIRASGAAVCGSHAIKEIRRGTRITWVLRQRVLTASPITFAKCNKPNVNRCRNETLAEKEVLAIVIGKDLTV